MVAKHSCTDICKGRGQFIVSMGSWGLYTRFIPPHMPHCCFPIPCSSGIFALCTNDSGIFFSHILEKCFISSLSAPHSFLIFFLLFTSLHRYFIQLPLSSPLLEFLAFCTTLGLVLLPHLFYLESESFLHLWQEGQSHAGDVVYAGRS